MVSTNTRPSFIPLFTPAKKKKKKIITLFMRDVTQPWIEGKSTNNRPLPDVVQLLSVTDIS